MRKMNVFGLPDVNVGTVDELAEIAARDHMLYQVVPVADMSDDAYPPELLKRMLRTPCEDCGVICRYDPKYFVPFSKVVCTRCCPARTVNHAAIGAITEVAAALNRTFLRGFLPGGTP